MKKIKKEPGTIRVGTYDWKTKKQPITPGFTNILIHVSEPLSPYVLKDTQGRIMENIFQFSKIYSKVKAQKQTVHRYTSTPGWTWPAEEHYNDERDEIISEKYEKWRKNGQEFKYAVRYPNGFHGRSECKFVLIKNSDYIEAMKRFEKLDIKECKETKELKDTKELKEAKKEISGWKKLNRMQGRILVYFKTYAQLARQDPFFKKVKERVANGENLQLIEVDGPRVDMPNCPPFEKVVNGSIHVEKYVVQEWLKGRPSFGHGICLAIALMDKDEWVYEMLQEDK